MDLLSESADCQTFHRDKSETHRVDLVVSMSKQMHQPVRIKTASPNSPGNFQASDLSTLTVIRRPSYASTTFCHSIGSTIAAPRTTWSAFTKCPCEKRRVVWRIGGVYLRDSREEVASEG